MAEAFYGVPEDLKAVFLKRIDPEMAQVIPRFYEAVNK